MTPYVGSGAPADDLPDDGFGDDDVDEDDDSGPSTSGRGGGDGGPMNADLIEELRRAGYKLSSTGGEVYFEKANAAPKAASRATARSAARSAGAAASSISAGSDIAAPAASAAGATAAAGGPPPSASAAAVADDFDPARWRLMAEAVRINDPRPETSGWWLPADDKTAGSSSAADDAAASALADSATVRRQLMRVGSPQEAVDLLKAVFPAWAANGWRLVHVSSGGAVEAPTPAEAAAALRGIALAAKCSAFDVDLRCGRVPDG